VWMSFDRFTCFTCVLGHRKLHSSNISALKLL
jgi:hypothetical protein